MTYLFPLSAFVRIKSSGRKGRIVTQRKRVELGICHTTYDVSAMTLVVGSDGSSLGHAVPVGETISEIPESDLELIGMNFSDLLDSFEIHHATSEQLDKLGNLYGLERECKHVFKKYQGLYESYRYCEKCDFKDKS